MYRGCCNIIDHFKAKIKILCKGNDEHAAHDEALKVQNCVQKGGRGAYFQTSVDQIVVFGEKEEIFRCFEGYDWWEGLRGHTSFLPFGHSSGGLPGRRSKDPRSHQQGLLQKVNA